MTAVRTMRALRDHVVGLSDRARGLDFISMVRPEEVGLDPAHANPCTPSGDRWLRNVLRTLSIDAGHSVLDVGCGKGSAMRVLLDHPFGRVDGIELSADLAAIARTNFERLRVPADRCRVLVADATTFAELDGYTHVYLANPFSGAVMAAFAEHLIRAERKSRIDSGKSGAGFGSLD